MHMTNGEFVAMALRIQQEIATNPAYANEVLLMDAWERENFAQYMDETISVEEWSDFVDYCNSDSPIPIYELFTDWKEIKASTE